MIDEALFEAEEKMEKAVTVAKDDLGGIRTGRANPPGMFNRIVVDYYGSPTPVTQIASINVPEARMVIVKPYEASQLGAIETAIRNSDLGVNPHQRRQHHPHLRSAAHGGAPSRTGQAGQGEGRGREGRGA